MAETYESLDEDHCANEKYKQVNDILNRGVNTDQHERAAILLRLAWLVMDDDLAHEYRAEAFELDQSNVEARYQLVRSLYSCKDHDGLRHVVTSVTDLKDTERQMTHLGCMIDMIIANEDSDTFRLLSTISSICSSFSACFDALLKDMETAINHAKENDHYHVWTTLLLHKGITLSCYSNDSSLSATAVEAWERCATIVRENIQQQAGGAILLEKVGRQLSGHYFNQTILDPANAPDYARKIEDVIEKQKGIVHGMSAAKTYLAAYRIRSNKEAARDLFKSDIKDAFALLSDSTTRNDHLGFSLLFVILLSCGEDVDALVTKSLLSRRLVDTEILKKWVSTDGEPLTAEAEDMIKLLDSYFERPSSLGLMFVIDRTEKKADMGGRNEESIYNNLARSLREYGKAMIDARHNYICDSCDSDLETESCMYACRYCYNVGLCESCHRDLINGKLKTPLCREYHNWLKLPQWNVESHILSYRRKVRLGAGIGEDGSLTRGDVVPASEWLDHLREDWGFAKEDWNFG